MCIVSLAQKSATHFILTHSRDENIYRNYTENIQKSIHNSNTVHYPKDLESNGTWIISSQKYIACLLNGENKIHIRKLPYKKSRGKILLELNEFQSIDSFVLEYNFTNFESFTLILIDIENNKRKIIVWNEIQLQIEDISSNKNLLKLSSTLYSDEIKTEKMIQFNEYQQNCHTKKDILQWHFDNRMLQNSIYPNIQTVCITQIELKENEISMDFICNVDKMLTL